MNEHSIGDLVWTGNWFGVITEIDTLPHGKEYMVYFFWDVKTYPWRLSSDGEINKWKNNIAKYQYGTSYR